MGVIEVGEVFDTEGSVDRSFFSTYRRKFQVTTDNAHDGPIIVALGLRSVAGIRPGMTYQNCLAAKWKTGDQPLTNAGFSESDPASFVSRIIARRSDQHPMHWEVTVEYEPYDIQLANESPLENRIEHKWSFEETEEIVYQDINGGNIVNAAFEPYKDPVTRPASHLILTLTRNEPIFDPAVAFFYKNKLNADTFWGADPGQALMANITGEDTWSPKVQTNNGVYWRVNYEVHFRVDETGWSKVKRNDGVNQRKDGVLEPILIGRAKQKTSEPLPLNDAGLYVEGGEIIYDSFDIIERVEFGPLLLEPNPRFS